MDYIKIIQNLEDKIQNFFDGDSQISEKENNMNETALQHFKRNFGKKKNGQSK
mgnify:CR=1 FL=1|tara:strand:+ start:373 stop:531 length:159 start_codon:yes stop_codon:yes gene_type:complete